MEPYSITRPGRSHVMGFNQLIPGDTVSARTRIDNVDSVLNGFKLPKWRELLRDHRNATTPCSGTRRSIDPGWHVADVRATRVAPPNVGSVTIYRSYGPMWGYDSLPGVASLPNASLDNVALTRFYSSASEIMSQANYLVALGEARETVRQLKHPMRSLTALLEKREVKLRRLSKKSRRLPRKIRLRNLSDAASGTWLEVQFGLKPLVSDISDLATYIQFRRFQLGIEYFKVKGKAVLPESVHSVRTDWIGSGGTFPIWFENYKLTSTRKSVRYIGEVKLDPLEHGLTRRDFNRLGFSLGQFIPTLWEITPWSFLIDYFSNIGDVINSFSVPRTSVVWFNKTMRSEVKVKYDLTGKVRSPYVSFGVDYRSGGASSNPAIGTVSQFVRSGGDGTNLPRPSISLDLPNWFQVSNIIALAANRSRNRFSNPL